MSRYHREHPEQSDPDAFHEAMSELADREKRREQNDPKLDLYEGKRRAIQDRIEEEYKKFGPNHEERVNMGMRDE